MELVAAKESESEVDLKVLGIYFTPGEVKSVQNCRSLSSFLYFLIRYYLLLFHILKSLLSLFG